MALAVIIDDDPDDIDLLIVAISDVSHDVKCVAYLDPSEAITALRSSSTPDYIFLDVNMPGMNGYECLSQLKTLLPLEHCPIIILSTWMLPDDRNKALREGATFAIQKPSHYSKLKEFLQTLFNSTR